MEFLINIIGLLIIDIGAMLYGRHTTDNEAISFVILLICNCVGGLLYKHKKV